MKKIISALSLYLLLSCLCMVFPEEMSAQGRTSMETSLLSLTEKDTTLAEVVKKVESETKFNFVGIFAYRDIKIAPGPGRRSLAAILDEARLKYPLTWKIDGWDIRVERILTIDRSLNSSVAQHRGIPEKKKFRFSGTVFDNTGQPLSEATIVHCGTNSGTITNGRGQFLLELADSTPLVAVSFIGCELVEDTLRHGAPHHFILKWKSMSIDTPVVVAYSTKTPRTSLENADRITAEEIALHHADNFAAILQGRVPGLNVVRLNGVTGSSFKFELRGRNSILNRGNPLFLVNGVPVLDENLNQLSSIITNNTPAGAGPFIIININEIESIQVLKDAIATSIYGSRGGNGVISVRLKSATPGLTRIVADVNSGFSMARPGYRVLSLPQYRSLRREAFENDGMTPGNTSGLPNYAPDLFDTSRKAIDWPRQLFGDPAFQTNVNLSVAGGYDSLSGYMGVGYTREASVLNNALYFQRLSFHAAGQLSFPDKRYTVQSQLYISSNMNKLYNGTSLGVLFPPNAASVREGSKVLQWADWMDWFKNPLADRMKAYKMNINSILLNVSPGFVNVEKTLKVRVDLGMNTNFVNENSVVPTGAQMTIPGTALRSQSFLASSTSNTLIVEPVAEYTFRQFRFMTGATYQYSSMRGDSSVGSPALLSGFLPVIREYKYVSLFGQLDYNRYNTYFFNLTVRHDGSSRYGPQTRYGTFGAVAAAVDIAKVPFLHIPRHILQYAKLRVSYGLTGSDQIGDYKYLQIWKPIRELFPGTGGISSESVYNPAFSWEQSRKLEFMLDFLLFREKLSGNITYYRNLNTRQLIDYKLTTQTGYDGVLTNFDAGIANRGVELFIGIRKLMLGEFELDAGFNLAIARNSLRSFSRLSKSTYGSKLSVGKSLNMLKGYDWEGVDMETGIDNFRDVNGDGRIDEHDLIYLGNTDPKFQGGMTLTVKYKSWSLNMSSEFKRITGPDYIYNAMMGGASLGSQWNQLDIVEQRWRKPGDNARFSKASALSNSLVNLERAKLPVSDRAYTDASFIKIRNINISYTIRSKDLKGRYNDNLQFYLNGENVLTISPYNSGDPEMANLYAVPTPMVIRVGTKIYFDQLFKH
ncbi:TonB-linked outer membrane protein, SusC/RagA family [Chitinophaga sp. YR627]|uniref:SusC/RagA family TonB-linked outer membrane protein n=1 Tax=Chitinophaga sp. YR627 TaxID=1881041 RepID=UPI0008E40748|nr:SusC/RagA family TonB-linked outer membrane protein [Chitinophaga sp. YR627]SFN33115.1 TonB-linked outer membrane protein, SusC/RagA family [Chitinophaga sp. YR627]